MTGVKCAQPITYTQGGVFSTTTLNDEGYERDLSQVAQAYGVNEIQIERSVTHKQANGSTNTQTEEDDRPIDNSFEKLFACMSVAYKLDTLQSLDQMNLITQHYEPTNQDLSYHQRSQLSSPKFKAFRGLKVTVKDKMRMNNIIWREWYLQFIKGRKPHVCSFNVRIDDTHGKAKVIVLEGKYWKRRQEVVCVEYMKWRVYNKSRLKSLTDEDELELEELLARVEKDEKAISTFVQNQNIVASSCSNSVTNSRLTNEDYKMDLNDDLLFNTFHSWGFPHQTARDFLAFENSDFMQPQLLGLEPDLDISDIDTLEPLQEMLAEVVGMQKSKPGQKRPSHGDFTIPVMPRASGTPPPPAYPEHKRSKSTAEGPFIPAAPSYVIPYNVPQTTQQIPVVSGHSAMSNAFNQQLNRKHVPQGTPSSHQNHLPHQQQQAPATYRQGAPAPTLHTYDSSPTSYDMSGAFRSDVNQQLSNTMQTAEPHLPAYNHSDTEFKVPNTTSASSSKLRTLVPKPSDRSVFLTQLLRNPLERDPTSGVPSVSSSSPLDLVASPAPVCFPSFTPFPFTPNISSSTFPSDVTVTQSSRANHEQINPVPPPPYSDLPTQDSIFMNSDEVFATVSSPEEDGNKKELVTAEQKRRYQINTGFDMLGMLLPNVSMSSNTKASKATMLTKACEYITELNRETENLEREIDILKQETDSVNRAIIACQGLLPDTGVPLVSQHKEQMNYMLDSYIREQTMRNWKFYIFSKMVKPLFSTYSSMVSTSNIQELYRTSQAWLDQHCSLVALRPLMLTTLRQLGTETTILTDPNRFPEQARAAVLQQTDQSQQQQLT